MRIVVRFRIQEHSEQICKFRPLREGNFLAPARKSPKNRPKGQAHAPACDAVPLGYPPGPSIVTAPFAYAFYGVRYKKLRCAFQEHGNGRWH